MSDDLPALQLQRMQQAFNVPDMHTVAIRLGVEYAQLRRWQDGAPIPAAILARAAERSGAQVAWLACKPGARAPRLTPSPGMR